MADDTNKPHGLTPHEMEMVTKQLPHEIAGKLVAGARQRETVERLHQAYDQARTNH